MDKKELESYILRIEAVFQKITKELGSKVSDQLEQGLTMEQFFLLRVVNQMEKATPTQLANEFGVKPSAITVMIDRLHKNEFVERERDENDRRVIFIYLTEKGKQILEQSEQKSLELMEKYMSKLERSELESLVLIYEKLAKIINENKEE